MNREIAYEVWRDLSPEQRATNGFEILAHTFEVSPSTITRIAKSGRWLERLAAENTPGTNATPAPAPAPAVSPTPVPTTEVPEWANPTCRACLGTGFIKPDRPCRACKTIFERVTLGNKPQVPAAKPEAPPTIAVTTELVTQSGQEVRKELDAAGKELMATGLATIRQAGIVEIRDAISAVAQGARIRESAIAKGSAHGHLSLPELQKRFMLPAPATDKDSDK